MPPLKKPHHEKREANDDRHRRHTVLLDVLRKRALSRQSEVVREMTRRGFEVTQSSISRDFRELGVVKLEGVYRAALDLAAPLSQSIVQQYVKSVGSAGSNLLVVHTATGAAAAVAEEIDTRDIDGVVGTVAGDNTIFIATRNKSAQDKVLMRIKSL